MINKNDINYTKIDITEQFNEANNAIEFLTSQNFQLYLKNKKITNINNYEKYYTIFSNNHKEHILKNGGNIYTAYLHEEVIGALYINNYQYIDSLFVKEEYRNKGIGSSLLTRLLNDYNEQTIKLSSSKDALRFYKKQGFTDVDKNDNFQLIYKIK